MTRARDAADQINRVNSSAANATAITIDSSENVLVGRTSTADTAVGAMLRPDGFLQSTRDGNIAADFNRNTSDGDIVRFSKGSSPVASIGNLGDYLYLGSPAGSDSFVLVGNSIFAPATSTGAARDAAIDLGVSDRRWKDLYLSGGVYLGGTGAANKLDDYEEGTWTPQHADGTNVSIVGVARYTKVGNAITIQADMVFSKTSGEIKGLPFTSIVNTNQTFNVGYSATTGNTNYGHMNGGGTSIGAWYNTSNTNTTFQNNDRIMITGTYFTS
tara:strand:- start:50 stop:865 length:816 start_codon:yes stop_codon:yes gene_type:complete